MPKNVQGDEKHLESRITELVRSKSKRTPVEPGTEIFYDLGIYGEDLFEIFDELIEEYEVDYSGLNVSSIAPGEGGGLFGLIVRLFGLRPYRSFTVQDLVNYTRERMSF